MIKYTYGDVYVEESIKKIGRWSRYKGCFQIYYDDPRGPYIYRRNERELL